MAQKRKKGGKKEKKVIHSGAAHIQATFNNTIISITDQKGKFSLGPLPLLEKDNLLRMVVFEHPDYAIGWFSPSKASQSCSHPSS